MVSVPHRSYFVAQGTSVDVDSWETIFENGWAPTPAFVWPADHAWCLAKDVDPHWAGIGGSQAAIDALINSSLDVVPARPTDDQPVYR